MDDNYTTARDQSEGHKALLELEKKFNKKARSAALNIQGSQIQALTGFIQIFEQYPYPVVINAAILKLADWFRTYNNIVKYYIYKVFKDASDLHLAKVINVEETVRRILPVLGSNDPVARSITLRVLGCMSMIIGEKLDVQYGILQQLELAKDRIELEAAIWAGDQICAKSNRFPSVIFSKIVDKLENTNTPFDIKLRLVKIFRHMHQDMGMARQAKATCLSLLEKPDTDSKLIIVTLRTLTLLLNEALIDQKEQMDRLLNYALNDKREDICYSVLQDLVLLGKGNIMFDESHVLRMLQIIVSSSEHELKIQQRAFQCAQSLIEGHQKVIMHIVTSSPESDTLRTFMDYIIACERIMNEAIEQHHHSVITASARFLYSIIRIGLSCHHAQGDNSMDLDVPVLAQMKELGKRVTEATTLLDIRVIKQNKQSNKQKLRELLKIKADFCLLLDDWDCDATFKNAYQLLADADDDTAAVLLPYLSTISRKCRQLLSWFPDEALMELKKRMKRSHVYVNLVRLLLRTTPPSDSRLTGQLITLLREFGRWDLTTEKFATNGWNLYLIGMEAGNCGWYELMYLVMKDLSKKAETEASSYWIASLSSLAYAEWSLSQNNHYSQNYITSLNKLKVLQAFDQPRTYQYWFIQLRMELIETIQRTLLVLNNMREMENCANQFRRTAFRYDFLAQSQFGIDKETLNVIESYKICALVCEHAVRTFIGTEHLFFSIDPSLIQFMTPLSTSKEEEKSITLCRDFMNTISSWEELTHLEDHDRRSTCHDDMKMILSTLLTVPLILPRSYFKTRKHVNIQLTTEPMLSEKKPITLMSNEDLVIKFEGLVEVNPQVKNSEKRIKKAVIVCFITKEKMLHFDDRLGVHMIFSEPTQILGAEGNQSALLQPPTIYMANVRNSYFTYTGLLGLPKSKISSISPGSKKEAWINVFIKILDDNSRVWSVGPLQWGKVIWQ